MAVSRLVRAGSRRRFFGRRRVRRSAVRRDEYFVRALVVVVVASQVRRAALELVELLSSDELVSHQVQQLLQFIARFDGGNAYGLSMEDTKAVPKLAMVIGVLAMVPKARATAFMSVIVVVKEMK